MPQNSEASGKSPTSSQLAKHLGLSRWTVSRVLNGHNDVSPKTRDRVLEAVKELGFRPSLLGRGLRGGRTGVIGICFQEIQSPVLAKKIGLLQRHLRQGGQRGILELNERDPQSEVATLHNFIDFRVDAILLIGSRLTATDRIFREMMERGIPVLAMDPESDLPIPTIRLDREAAMRQCLNHLLSLGHRRFALLGINGDPIYGPARRLGLTRALREAGIEAESALLDVGAPNGDLWSYDYGHQLGARWMDLPDPPRAAIALNDRIAIGAIRALRDRGRRIPEDFSIIGFDNIEIGQWTEPSLTTISQETTQSTQAIIDTLRRLLNESIEVPPNQTIAPRLLVRGSTGPAAK